MKRYIGGEFEISALPRPIETVELTQGIAGSWTASGRAALCALLEPLKKQGISKVLLPAYLCESILQPVRACGLDYEYYPVDENLAAYPEPPKDSVVILIHYFGWLNPNTQTLRKAAGNSFILIEDMTHAVFSEWKLVNRFPYQIFFSLRKFGPVPLGGWYSHVETLPPSDPIFNAIFWKSMAVRLYKYNYLRINNEVNDRTEQTYLELIHEVESFFDYTCTPCDLVNEARYLINGIDWGKAAAARRRNWNDLRLLLGNTPTPFHETLPNGVVPLGYVIRCAERDKVRRNLAARKIFCPVHWPLPADVDPKRFPVSKILSNSLLTIPTDQRYKLRDMEYITRIFRQISL